MNDKEKSKAFIQSVSTIMMSCKSIEQVDSISDVLQEIIEQAADIRKSEILEDSSKYIN